MFETLIIKYHNFWYGYKLKYLACGGFGFGQSPYVVHFHNSKWALLFFFIIPTLFASGWALLYSPVIWGFPMLDPLRTDKFPGTLLISLFWSKIFRQLHHHVLKGLLLSKWYVEMRQREDILIWWINLRWCSNGIHDRNP